MSWTTATQLDTAC